MTNKQEKTFTKSLNLYLLSAKEMVEAQKKELAKTPKWKFLKRKQLKRSIKFWEGRDD